MEILTLENIDSLIYLHSNGTTFTKEK